MNHFTFIHMNWFTVWKLTYYIFIDVNSFTSQDLWMSESTLCLSINIVLNIELIRKIFMCEYVNRFTLSNEFIPSILKSYIVHYVLTIFLNTEFSHFSFLKHSNLWKLLYNDCNCDAWELIWLEKSLYAILRFSWVLQFMATQT